MSCHKGFETKSLAIPDSEFNFAEALFYEYNARRRLLTHINKYHIDVPIEVKKEYIFDCLKYEDELNETLLDLAKKHIESFDICVNLRIDVEKKLLLWDERILR